VNCLSPFSIHKILSLGWTSRNIKEAAFNLTGMTHKTQGWGWCREDAGQLPAVRKGKL
ncbi:hypothetical protein HGM15179_009898, partial [Zosterops borbonicus]